MKTGFLNKRAISELIKSLETSIQQKEALKIAPPTPPSLKVFPYRLVYLQGQLSLIGENICTHQLIILDIQEIETVQVIQQKYQNNFSTFDIDHFINANRKMSDQEYRLVIKLSSLFANIDLKPKFHFFGNPCLISNSQGEFIWGASVELNDELLKWLSIIKNDVHIINPEIQYALEQYLTKVENN